MYILKGLLLSKNKIRSVRGQKQCFDHAGNLEALEINSSF